ncbi:MAG: hypothetical protein RIC19_16195 [Phaeodactylibacter sp.]|uniref:hypothetical protein n=1 Tax=Phaeodactylibacter sp. TaxID=1940289 RepID=UPI0032ECF0AE
MENEALRADIQENVLIEAIEETEEFQWIVNEDLLRDEGVVYGLTEGDAKEKLQTIELYYAQKAKSLQVQAGQVYGQIQKEEGELLLLEERIEREQAVLQSLEEERNNQITGFLRQTVNLFCYAVAVVLTFWLTYSWIDAHLEYPLLITTGVYVFGSLNLFTPGSFLFATEAAHQEENPRERWKLLVEELAVPFVAVLFVVTWGYNGQALHEALALGLLLYALFLFAGKGLLTTIGKWTISKRALQHKWADQRLVRQRITEQKDLLAELAKAKEELGQQLLERYGQKHQLDKDATDLLETGETRKAYFMSEFALARSARNQLSGEQLVQLSAFKKA